MTKINKNNQVPKNRQEMKHHGNEEDEEDDEDSHDIINLHNKLKMLRQQLYGTSLSDNNDEENATEIEIENNLSDTSEEENEDASMALSTLDYNNQTLNSLDIKAKKLIEKRFGFRKFQKFVIKTFYSYLKLK
jgi:hypothetical protein